MSTLREAAQQALEALEDYERHTGFRSTATDSLRSALAELEQEQEPFGYIWPTGRHPEFRYIKQMRDGVAGMPLYAHTPRHEWKGLTDTEIGMLYVTWDATPRVSMADFARAIEQACKERNT